MIDLIPIEQAWVCKSHTPEQIGSVLSVTGTSESPLIEVDFGPNGKATLALGEWGCGLKPGFIVQDVPLSAVRKTLGTGVVLKIRNLASREQALVQFHLNGECLWMPYERLRRVMGTDLRFRRAQMAMSDSPERLAVNVMGHALRSWNEATGALDRLDVDPLPHQIGLVHRILNSGHTNWLIADDVGLGKTIEVGLLLAALERRQNLRRILVVVPSGLTRQWKDEMRLKFDRRFLIYGVDFRPEDPGEWGLFERVIVSLDFAKPRGSEDDGTDSGTPFGMLLAAGSWDVIIFDEAHRLSRDEDGRSTLRYRLGQSMRAKTDAMVLLTGTPHQGDSGKFQNLLTLVRPDLTHAIGQLDVDPSAVGEIVLRNRKIDAVNLEGNFLFKGLLVKRVEVIPEPAFVELQKQLSQYLKRGYLAGDEIGGSAGRAVGFVMTTYRKLASSSSAALWMALRKRLDRLNGSASAQAIPGENVQADAAINFDSDAINEDSLAEHSTIGTSHPFFDEERQLLEGLIEATAHCMRNDGKGARLIDIATEIVKQNQEKLLIFTEYRATQAYLAITLQSLTGRRPALINGGQTSEEKRAAVEDFENESDILISTEAGAEGLNLHRRCHVLINFDLPWNPSRLTQRIGRLYRYGQDHQVIVFNMQSRDTIDNEIISTVLDRVEVLVREMASVGPEFNELYAAEIMGELLERVDISAMLEEARFGRIERSAERIDLALKEAKRAKELQDDLLSFASKFEISSWQDLGSLTTADVATFIKRCAPLLGFELVETRSAEHFTLRLPQEYKGAFSEFGARTVVQLTTDRSYSARRADDVLIDFSTTFLRFLVETVTAEGFGGTYASLANKSPAAQFAAFLARFQNDQGSPDGEQLMVVQRDEAGAITTGAEVVKYIFGNTLIGGLPISNDLNTRKSELAGLKDRCEVMMANQLSKFRHPNDLVLIAVGESAETVAQPALGEVTR